MDHISVLHKFMNIQVILKQKLYFVRVNIFLVIAFKELS